MASVTEPSGAIEQKLPYPVRLEVDYPERLSRKTLLLKTFLGWAYVGIPFGFFIYFYVIAVYAVTFAAWWIVLVTGKYPRGLFNFVANLLRWGLRVAVYNNLMRDEYPLYSDSVSLEIQYPEKLSRGILLLKWFFGWAYVVIPHGIALILYGIAVGIVTFVSFWVILFTEKYPRGLFNFVEGGMRWSTRMSAYLLLLRDEYPPFSGQL